MADDTYLYSVFWFVVLIVSVFAMQMISTVVKARAKMAEEGDYRRLAERAVMALEQQTDCIEALRSDLAAARTSLANVEKILKQVG
jgi:5-bromo-4-chloroindolyl phosphate hydrolysis protein